MSFASKATYKTCSDKYVPIWYHRGTEQPIALPSHPSLGTLGDYLYTGKDSSPWVHTNGQPHGPSCRIDA